MGIIGITIVGIRYLTTGNNVEQAEKAKRRIPQIVLGLIIYALLYAGLQFLMPGGNKSSWIKFTHSGYHFICVLGIDPSNNKVFVGNAAKGKKGWYKLSDVAKAVRPSQFWLEVYK